MANVTLSVWFRFPSSTVQPTALCRFSLVEVMLVGCSPVALGLLLVQLKVVV